MITLIDADLVAYRSAASCEPTKIKSIQEPLEIAIRRCDDLMNRIIHETQATSYEAYLTGSSNFRYQVDPEYKANRVNMKRPDWLQPVREHLVMYWNALVTDGLEADDMLGIRQTQLRKEAGLIG